MTDSKGKRKPCSWTVNGYFQSNKAKVAGAGNVYALGKPAAAFQAWDFQVSSVLNGLGKAALTAAILSGPSHGTFSLTGENAYALAA